MAGNSSLIIKTMERLERNKLIKRYHTLLSLRKVSNLTKESLLGAYGVSSSTELTNVQLKELCDYIQAEVNLTKEELELDRWRKSVIKVISKSLEIEDKGGHGCEYVKAVAARAAQYDKFNQIPKNKLIDIYHAFNNKCKITAKVLNKAIIDISQLN